MGGIGNKICHGYGRQNVLFLMSWVNCFVMGAMDLTICYGSIGVMGSMGG